MLISLATPLLLLLALIQISESSTKETVIGDIGPMGKIVGVEKRAYNYADAPHSGRRINVFRNIPYAEHSIAGKYRFTQSKVRTSPYNGPGDQPLDATKTGPLCQQGTLENDNIETLFHKTLEEVLITALPDIVEGLIPHVVIKLLLEAIEFLIEVPDGTLDPSKTIQQVAHDWLDIDLSVDEECLHLAVSTPMKPDGVAKPLLPVMFFIHGGGFSSGFQIRMGSERLMAWGDVVLVAINYRLNALGFLCLDSNEAAGNMGMLDIITALEWVHNNIAYFGGNPDEITIFGESAGSATIGHMLLSNVTNGLFARGIGSSGSPLATWAFDKNPQRNGRDIAARAGCTNEDTEELIACLRDLDSTEITAAFSAYQQAERKSGRMGFGGSTPCAQTKGEKKFYSENQTPESILFSGEYEHVPIFFGANKREGSYVYTVFYNQFLLPNNLHTDFEYLKYDFVPALMQITEVSNYYGFKELLQNNFFDDGQLGDLYSMIPGIEDVLSVFFFKASAYELVQKNSAFTPSYWYALDYSNSDKSFHNLQYINPADKANLTNPGTCHGDESLYMFNIELPLVFCNIQEIARDAKECLNHLDALFCLTLPNGKFRKRWHNCLTGVLTDEELKVSAAVSQLWTNFAIYGDPGFGSQPWDKETMSYVHIDKEVSIKQDYTKEYHIALEEAREGIAP